MRPPLTTKGAGRGAELDQNSAVATEIAKSAVAVSTQLSQVRQVVDDLVKERGSLKTFVTLSPVPRFAQWLADVLAEESGAVPITPADRAKLAVLDDTAWVDEPTVADVAVYGDVAYAEEGAIDLGPYANVKAWMARIEKLPGFKKYEDVLPKQDAA
jgi:hypothetical protein